ncbi:MAG: hypothetical protein NZ739_07750 [Verrucomicrobiae bacterium]|nr:hypothetical protein [Verrucomicrobiae bacterium]MCX7721610.1 hypothetical protein [Verrucomicrobiae bacterium]MDW7979632.1 hypothetical protein [Verrucomicrobiales bacterium]
MPDQKTNPQPLRALKQLARGLSALFWGLPIALVVCVWTAQTQRFRPFGFAPPTAALGLLLYGVVLLGKFQPHERVWRRALDQALLLAMINLGLSPFLYWWSKMPGHPFFTGIVQLLTLTGLVFLIHLNQVLLRLSTMLPDETLRAETRQFAPINRILLGASALLTVAYILLTKTGAAPPIYLRSVTLAIEDKILWLLVPFILLPLAMTMALIWKTKETILESVFNSLVPRNENEPAPR